MKDLFQQFGKGFLVERKLFLILLGVFIGSALLGYLFPEQITEALKTSGLDKALEEKMTQFQPNSNYLYLFSNIFLNNFMASIMMILVGALLFFFPIMGIITNGMLVGYVVSIASHATGSNPFYLIATTILPHGILEIPAILFASVLGIRIGLLFWRYIFYLGKPEEKEAVVLDLKAYFHRFSFMLFIVTMFLILAAAIESALFFLLV